MDVEKLFHMSPGFGSTSYAQNSSFQKKGSEMAKHITMEALQKVCVTLSPKSIGIADLGCSSGPNTLAIIRDFIEAIEELREVREVRVYLNDLPSNDFNLVFRSLPDLYEEVKRGKSSSSSVYIAAYPGSFYGRLFPNNYLHFVYSSFSLHWLSKVPTGLYDEEGKPINKGSTYICESSPAVVAEAYMTQFKEDFSLFLQSRAQELSSGCCMVLILLGRAGPDHADRGNSFFWQLLSRSFSILVSQGEVEKEKVDSYDVHFYPPSRDEIEAEVERDGSFEFVKFEMFEPDKGYEGNYGKDVAMTVRAVQESMISHHFGEDILDPLFNVYERIVDDEFLKQEISPLSFAIVLRKL